MTEEARLRQGIDAIIERCRDVMELDDAHLNAKEKSGKKHIAMVIADLQELVGDDWRPVANYAYFDSPYGIPDYLGEETT